MFQGYSLKLEVKGIKKFTLTSVSDIITYNTIVIGYKQIIWPLYPKLESYFCLAGAENFSFKLLLVSEAENYFD
jgi:hypothetical protein